MTKYAVLENGYVREIATTDAPRTHAQHANLRIIPQDGDPARFVGMKAEELPNVDPDKVRDGFEGDLHAHSYDRRATAAAETQQHDRIVTQSKTANMDEPKTAAEAIQWMRDDGDADPEGTARLNYPHLFKDQPKDRIYTENKTVKTPHEDPFDHPNRKPAKAAAKK